MRGKGRGKEETEREAKREWVREILSEIVRGEHPSAAGSGEIKKEKKGQDPPPLGSCKRSMQILLDAAQPCLKSDTRTCTNT